MSMEFRIRDWLRPPARILMQAGFKTGMTVLDFGCGPGGFSAAARLVGNQGRVYAMDIHPLAIRAVRSSAARNGLDNIQTLFGTSLNEVPGETVDLALLYDVLHDIQEPGSALEEIHRVLKPQGILSVRDHHIKGESLTKAVTERGLFHLVGRTRWSCQFHKSTARQVNP